MTPARAFIAFVFAIPVLADMSLFQTNETTSERQKCFEPENEGTLATENSQVHVRDFHTTNEQKPHGVSSQYRDGASTDGTKSIAVSFVEN